MTDIIKSTTHVVDAQARVAGYLRDAPNFNKLIGIFAERWQGLEDELDDFLNNITDLVANAVGAQLNIIGIILNLTRDGEPDPEYRIRLLGQAAALAKSGEPETVISAYKLATGGDKVVLQEPSPAAVLLTAFFAVPESLTAAQDAAILATMNEVIIAGVSAGLLTVDDNAFLWGDVADADANGDLPASNHGWGDVADADGSGNIPPGSSRGNFARVIT